LGTVFFFASFAAPAFGGSAFFAAAAGFFGSAGGVCAYPANEVAASRAAPITAWIRDMISSVKFGW
jgi:hypothetical protein